MSHPDLKLEGATAQDLSTTGEQTSDNTTYDFEEAMRKNSSIKKRGEKMRAAINASVIRAYNIKARRGSGGGGGTSGSNPPSVPSP